MGDGDEFRTVETVLSPKSVAIVGASERGRWPQDIFNASVQGGYSGDIFLINPRQAEVYGRKAYPSLKDLPKVPDHAIVIVPGSAVPGVLEDAAAAGVKSATVYAGAVGDGESEASHERGRAVREIVARTGIRVAGPNCMGAFSYREKLFAYPNRAVAKVPAGPVACVFQSGGTLQFFMGTGASRGLRFSYGVSSGNELDLDLADYLNFMVDDPHTRQIVLFIEGVRRPQAFMRAAERALVARKPIIAIKTGASAKSAQAAASHTGAVAGDFSGYLAMCERYGIVNCRDLDQLVETTLAFQCGRAPKGPARGLDHHVRRHGRPALRRHRARRLVAARVQRRERRGAAAVHAGRHPAEEPARLRHSHQSEGRRQHLPHRRERPQRRYRRMGRASCRRTPSAGAASRK